MKSSKCKRKFTIIFIILNNHSCVVCKVIILWKMWNVHSLKSAIWCVQNRKWSVIARMKDNVISNKVFILFAAYGLWSDFFFRCLRRCNLSLFFFSRFNNFFWFFPFYEISNSNGRGRMGGKDSMAKHNSGAYAKACKTAFM